jgi:transposase
MELTDLFTAALGLKEPWEVETIRFEPEAGAIHFDLTCTSKRLNCPACGAEHQPIHDRQSRSWQHLHFFQYQAFLHAGVPRVRCGDCGKVTQVEVPWSRPGSGFTLLMDALVLTLAMKLPVSAIAKLLGVSASRIWQTINVHVEAARRQETHEYVTVIGVDEKHVGKKLGYITIVHDAKKRRTLFCTAGRKASTLGEFKADLVNHGGEPEAVEAIAMDLSKAYQAGATKEFPQAQPCFDAFHVSKLVHEALETVRRAEVKQVADLKGTRWGTLKSPEEWTVEQTNDMHWLQRSGLKTARAWRMKERFKEIHQRCRQGEPVEPLYRAWISWAKRSRLEPFKKLANTIKLQIPRSFGRPFHEHSATHSMSIRPPIPRAFGH